MSVAEIALHGIDPAFAEEFDRRFREAFSAHDADGLLALLAEDVTYIDPSWPREMHGHAEVREYLESTWRSSSDMRVEHVEAGMLDQTGPRTARRWRLTGTNDGVWDPPGLKPSGRRMVIEGAALFEYRGERASEVRMYFDVADVMRQLGVLPPVGSIGERLAVLVTNLTRPLRRR